MDFAANSQRLDPYKNFKFRLMVDGRPVFGANSAHNGGIAALTVASEVVLYRAGGNAGPPIRSPERPKIRRDHSAARRKLRSLIFELGQSSVQNERQHRRFSSVQEFSQRYVLGVRERLYSAGAHLQIFELLGFPISIASRSRWTEQRGGY